MKKLLIATRNDGKLKEMISMLEAFSLHYHFLKLNDIGITSIHDEVGNNLYDNAIIKARTYAKLSGMLTIADDSGLEVDALNGQPGVYTARYGGVGLNAKERCNYLLEKLRGVTWEHRTARFHCFLVLAQQNRIIDVAEGTQDGMIAQLPRGRGDFGYGPIFYVPQTKCTMAELPPRLKQEMSHRKKALAKLVPTLQYFEVEG